MENILVIEDNPVIAEGIKTLLTEEHFDTEVLNDGLKGYEEALHNHYKMIILDINLPGKNGYEICSGLRKNNIDIPILMVTCKTEETDKVVGLEIGADDYLTKPFGNRELIARVHALLRRTQNKGNDLNEYSFGNVTINFNNYEGTRGNTSLYFSTMEIKLLKYLIAHLGEVVKRNKLLDDVWGYDNFPTTRTIDNFIMQIRKKIEEDPADPKHLLTVYKAGYKFVA